MSTLTRFDSNGLELVIDIETGESFASIRAVARMCDTAESKIRYFSGAQLFELKTAEVHTPGGLQGAQLLNEDQILEVAAKYKPELVQAFAKLGLRASLHQLAGYTVSSTAVESKPETPAVNPKDAFILEVIKVGLQAATIVHDDRAALLYNVQLQNLACRLHTEDNSETSTVKALPQEVWLTVSEVLQQENYSYLNKKAVQNTLGQIGKLVKAHYEAETGLEPKVVTKSVGTNHKSTEIKLYPEHFHPTIVRIAWEYWNSKNLLW